MKRQNNLTIALLAAGLLAICGLSYGITAGKLGFFLDDWYIIWTYRTFGAGKFVEFFRGDRPLFSYIYRVFIPLIGDSPLGWQLFAIFTKWLSALALWKLLHMFLPEKKWFTYAVAALFVVYPGFKFHYFAVMYSQNYALFTIYLLSYIFMVLAIRNPKKRPLYIGLGTICQFIGIAPMELYYGLELVRPILIYLEISTQSNKLKARLIDTAKFWLPYFLVLIGFTLFRVLYSQIYSYQIGFLDQLKSDPLATLKGLLLRIVHGLLDSCVNVWLNLKEVLTSAEGAREILNRIGLIAVGFLTTLLFLNKTGQRGEVGSKRISPWLVALGIYVVLVGMIPFLIAGLDAGLEFHNNRFLLPLSIGAVLLIVTLIDFVLQNLKVKSLLIALLVAFSIGANYLNGVEFQKAWEAQKYFFAQLTWRIPQIEPGTVIITPNLPFSLYYSGPSLTAPLNLIYAPKLHENPIPYQMILAGSEQMKSMPRLIPDQEIERFSRVFRFVGNTSDMVAVYMPDQGCLKVISPDTDSKSFQSVRYVELWDNLSLLSNLSRIDTEAWNAVLPSQYFGEVSTDSWCYYYQRAALADQRKLWTEVIDEYEQANASGFSPENASEWLPLISAKIELDDAGGALSISENIAVGDEFTARGLCLTWQKSEIDFKLPERERLEVLLDRWQCDGK